MTIKSPSFRVANAMLRLELQQSSDGGEKLLFSGQAYAAELVFAA
jgi:hypothetical protein